MVERGSAWAPAAASRVYGQRGETQRVKVAGREWGLLHGTARPLSVATRVTHDRSRSGPVRSVSALRLRSAFRSVRALDQSLDSRLPVPRRSQARPRLPTRTGPHADAPNNADRHRASRSRKDDRASSLSETVTRCHVTHDTGHVIMTAWALWDWAGARTSSCTVPTTSRTRLAARARARYGLR